MNFINIRDNKKIDYRPKLHFTAKSNWINDPNGLVYFDGEWHLFFQYNPFGNVWGHMNWGHAVSKDLLHWQELEIAIPEAPNHMIFSGSCVIDWKNSTGFGDGVNPPMVAIYTDCAQDFSNQSQSLAFSLDKGRTFIKYSGNPVLDIGQKDFRDPKVFWHEPTQKWIMAIANSKEQMVSFYNSKDLKTWKLSSKFGPAGANGNLWECPDLFPLKVNGTEEIKWVLKIDIFEVNAEKYSMAQVFIGDFDGETFTPIRNNSGEIIWQRADFGHDFYAAMSFSDVAKSDGRRIWMAWMNSHHYANATPTTPWRGAMTLPREVKITKISDNYHLQQMPISEITHMDNSAVALNTFKNSALYAHVFYINTNLEKSNDAIFELKFENGESLQFGYESSTKKLFVDRSKCGELRENQNFAQIQSATRISNNFELKINIFVDTCSIELFFDDGIQVFSETFYTHGTKYKLEKIGSFNATILGHSLGAK